MKTLLALLLIIAVFVAVVVWLWKGAEKEISEFRIGGVE